MIKQFIVRNGIDNRDRKIPVWDWDISNYHVLRFLEDCGIERMEHNFRLESYASGITNLASLSRKPLCVTLEKRSEAKRFLTMEEYDEGWKALKADLDIVIPTQMVENYRIHCPRTICTVLHQQGIEGVQKFYEALCTAELKIRFLENLMFAF